MEEKPEFATQEQTQEEPPANQQESLSPEKKKSRLETKARRFFSAMMASAVLGLGLFETNALAAETKELKLPPTTEKILTPEEARVVQLRAEMGAPQKTERILSPKEKRVEHLKYLQKMAIESDTEHYSVSITKKGKNGNAYFVETESGGNETFTLLPINDIEIATRNKTAVVEVAHTHPKKLIDRSFDQKTGSYVMPPSLTDLISYAKRLDSLNLKQTQLKETVVDPTGFWEVSMDQNSSIYEKLRGVSTLEEAFSYEKLGLTDDEADITDNMLNEKNEEIEKLGNIIEIRDFLLTSFPQNARIIKKIEDAMTKIMLTGAPSTIENASDFTGLPNIEVGANESSSFETRWQELREYERKSPIANETEDEIKKFISYWGARGLYLKYTQFKDVEQKDKE